MHEWGTRMLLKQYLDQGLTKAELSRRFGVSRRTIHYWIESARVIRASVQDVAEPEGSRRLRWESASA